MTLIVSVQNVHFVTLIYSFNIFYSGAWAEGSSRAADRGGGATGAFCPGPHYVGGPKGQARGIQ